MKIFFFFFIKQSAIFRAESNRSEHPHFLPSADLWLISLEIGSKWRFFLPPRGLDWNFCEGFQLSYLQNEGSHGKKNCLKILNKISKIVKTILSLQQPHHINLVPDIRHTLRLLTIGISSPHNRDWRIFWISSYLFSTLWRNKKISTDFLKIFWLLSIVLVRISQFMEIIQFKKQC